MRGVVPRSATSFQCVCCDHFLMRMRLILQINALIIEMFCNALTPTMSVLSACTAASGHRVLFRDGSCQYTRAAQTNRDMNLKTETDFINSDRLINIIDVKCILLILYHRLLFHFFFINKHDF